jgi:Zn-finger nucleic acid-binding protein
VNCPDCRAPLEHRERWKDLTLDDCPSCGGAWFEEGELERLGERCEPFRAAVRDAWQTRQVTTRTCRSCGQMLERAWLEELEIELFSCSGCKGLWLNQDRLMRVRRYLSKRVGLEEPAKPANPPQTRRVAVFLACALAALWLLPRLRGRPAPARPRAPPAPPQLATSWERDARESKGKARAAEARGALDAALDGYYDAADRYYVAIATESVFSEAWRLEEEYAKVGESIARLEMRRGQPSEAEKIQKIRLDIFGRHELVAGQAAAWRGLAEASAAAGDRAVSAQRYEKAAAYYWKAGDQAASAACRTAATEARRPAL